MKISFIKLISIMFLISFIASCASVKDFQKMNKDQRAVKLCKGSSVVSSYDIKIRHSRSKLNNIESLLTKGYRSVESCNTKVFDTGKKDKKGVAKDSDLIITTIQKLNNAISGHYRNQLEHLKNALLF